MDETIHAPRVEAPAPAQSQGEQTAKEGEANKASALEAVTKTRENLAHVATGREIHMDVHGNMLSQRDMDELKANGPQERISGGRLN